jgi:hypothetical protein
MWIHRDIAIGDRFDFGAAEARDLACFQHMKPTTLDEPEQRDSMAVEESGRFVQGHEI